MARIFITGSADGLGLMAAKRLVGMGHSVVLHARNEDRAAVAMRAVPAAEDCLTGDLSSISETIKLAEKANAGGHFHSVIHNAAIGYRESSKIITADGLAQIFAVNSLAPYILTALIHKPERLIYLSSGLHQQGSTDMSDLNWNNRSWNGYQAYADSKFHDLLLAFAVSRKWKDVCSNALEPGWVATKMGGRGAPDDLQLGAETQVWLAGSNDTAVKVSGKYFFHQKIKAHKRQADDAEIQDHLLDACQRFSGVKLP